MDHELGRFLWLCMPTIKSEPDAPYIMRNLFVDVIVKFLKVVSREEFQLYKCQSFASELFLGTLPQHRCQTRAVSSPNALIAPAANANGSATAFYLC